MPKIYLYYRNGYKLKISENATARFSDQISVMEQKKIQSGVLSFNSLHKRSRD